MGVQLAKKLPQDQRCGRRRHNHCHCTGTAIIREGLKNVAAGANPMFLKRGIGKRWKSVNRIEELAKPVETKERYSGCFHFSDDPEIGVLISDAMEKVGKDGVITVEESIRSALPWKLWKECSLTAAIYHTIW